MEVVRLTKQAVDLLRSFTINEFVGEGMPHADGTMDAPVHADTLAQLKQRQRDGESLSDVVIRICSPR